MTGANEFKLTQGPEDSISAVKFSPTSPQFLLVSSWDCTVRLYDVSTNSMRMKYQHLAPVLDCAFYVRIHFTQWPSPFISFHSWSLSFHLLGSGSCLERRSGQPAEDSWSKHRSRWTCLSHITVFYGCECVPQALLSVRTFCCSPIRFRAFAQFVR